MTSEASAKCKEIIAGVERDEFCPLRLWATYSLYTDTNSCSSAMLP